MNRSLTTAVVLATVSLVACGSSGEEVKGMEETLNLSHETAQGVTVAVESSERLGWQVIQAGSEANRVVSPSSLTMSLAQAAEGAEGVSSESIDAALGLTGEARGEAFGALRQSLLEYDSLPREIDPDNPPEDPVIHQASRVVAIDSELEQAFLDQVSRYYDAPATQVSLGDAKADLDRWAREHTAGMIDGSAIEPDEDIVAVLQDALLFAAQWETPFETELPMTFHGVGGTAEVDGVFEELEVAFAEGERWQAVRLPFDDSLAADVILPKEGTSPEELTVEELGEAGTALDAADPDEKVRVTMPAFNLETAIRLNEALPELDLSDLGGMFDGAFVDEWVQQSTLVVTARGTVGAALTEMAEVGAAPGQKDPREFTVDRPYVFRVLDTRTDWPLFLALIGDPADGGE